MSKLNNNNIQKNIEDKKFLDDYWSRYQKILFDSRDDESILTLRNAIKEIHQKKGN